MFVICWYHKRDSFCLRESKKKKKEKEKWEGKKLCRQSTNHEEFMVQGMHCIYAISNWNQIKPNSIIAGRFRIHFVLSKYHFHSISISWLHDCMISFGYTSAPISFFSSSMSFSFRQSRFYRWCWKKMILKNENLNKVFHILFLFSFLFWYRKPNHEQETKRRKWKKFNLIVTKWYFGFCYDFGVV